jgi:hypothetical protein
MQTASTKFEHKDIYKVTWISPDGCTLNQIDHFVIDTRHISNVMDIRTYRGANIDSDHYLVGAKMRARISNAKKKCCGSRQEKFDTQALKDKNIIKYYVDKIQTLLSSSAVDKCWITGRNVIKKAAEEVVGTKQMEVRKKGLV